MNQLTVFNLALTQLEQRRLATVDDRSEEAERLREFEPLAIRTILRETLWQNFKTSATFRDITAELKQQNIPFPVNFNYCYVKPDNCVTLVFPNAEDRKYFEPRAHPTQPINLVFTIGVVPSFDFIKFVNIYELWHAEQLECLAWKIANYLAPFYLNDSGKVTRISRMLQGKIDKAAVFSGQEVGEENVERFDSVDDSRFDSARSVFGNHGYGPRRPGYSPSRDGF